MDALLERLPALAAAHLRLALGALGIGALLSVPLGAFLHRRTRWKGPVLGLVGVVQTIPSLALLAFMVPVIAALAPWVEAATGARPSAIGAGPALLALTVYGVLPILQNTVAGLGSVDPALVEAARGVGMTSSQRLWRVELALAAPVIVAGLRTAAVWTVGTAVLATPIGASSLGDYIFIGLQTRNQASIAVGCAASAVLAIGLDLWVRGLEAAVARRAWKAAGALGAALLAVGLATGLPAGAVSGLLTGTARDRPPARVGAKAFTEAYVMAEIFAARLEAVGLEPRQVGSLGSTVVFDALAAGELDLYLDFTGTVLFNVMKVSLREGETEEEVRARIETWLRDTHDIRVAAVLGYENRYAFALRKDRARALGVETLSELVPHAPELSLASSYEFFDRPEWRAVQEAYGIRFAETTAMEQALAYEAVRADERDAMVAYSTDARVDGYDLRLLDDDRGAIPPYEAVVLARGAFLDAHPEAARALGDLEGRFSEAAVRALNAAVDVEGRSPREAARAWLDRAELPGP